MGVLKSFNMVEERTSTTGDGNLVLTGALPGRRTFALAVPAGDLFWYRLEPELEPKYWEIGLGKLVSGQIQRVNSYTMVWTGSEWDNGVGPYSLPAGIKRVAIIAPGNEAPIASLAAPGDGPRIDYDAGARHAIAWGRLASVSGGTNGAALGTSTVSNLGGAALGYAAQALAPASAALVGGVASATARNAIAGPGAYVKDGGAVMIGAYPHADSATSRYSQAGLIARGVRTVGAVAGAMKLYFNRTDGFGAAERGAQIDGTIFGHNGATGGAYSARVRLIVTGSTTTPTILHSAVSDVVAVGSGTSITAPVIAAGTAGEVTVTVTGLADETWVWTLSGIVVEHIPL